MSSKKGVSVKAMKQENKENSRPKKKSRIPVVEKGEGQKRVKAKPAPDFSRLHSDWNQKLLMGKACVKKPCTVSEEFSLTKPGTKPAKIDTPNNKLTPEDRLCFTPDAKSLRDLQLNREMSPSKQTGRSTIATSRIKPTRNYHVLKEKLCQEQTEKCRPPAKRTRTNAASLVEQQKEADIRFESDGAALNSIMLNTGIENHAQPSWTPRQVRSSIYYTGHNRVSLFDKCIKKRLLTTTPEVKRILESDRVCFKESPLVTGPIVKCSRNTVYPEYLQRPFMTPTTPKTNPTLSATKTNGTTARRVPNPNYRSIESPAQITLSARRVKKTLRWAEILASPSSCQENASSMKTERATPSTPAASEHPARQVSTSVSSNGCMDMMVSSGLAQASMSTSVPEERDESSVKARMSHPPLNNTGGRGSSSSSSIDSHHNSSHCVRAGLLPTVPASSTHVSVNPPDHAITRHSSTALGTGENPGSTSSNVHPVRSVPAMIDIVTAVTSHPGDVSCQRQLQNLEAKELLLLREMQQLSMAMSEDQKQEDNDNNHHHNHPTHHQAQHQLTQDHPAAHPTTSIMSNVIHHLLTSQAHPSHQHLPRGTDHSNVSRTMLAYSSVTQGIPPSAPSDINRNLTAPSTSQGPSREQHDLFDQRSEIQRRQSHTEMQRQLMLVQQQRQELLRVQRELELRLQESASSRGPTSDVQVQPEQSEHNNNNTDLKCNTQSIPAEPQAQTLTCRQDVTSLKSGDINDNYQTSCCVASSSAAATSHVVSYKKSLTTPSEVHAGHGQPKDTVSSLDKVQDSESKREELDSSCPSTSVEESSRIQDVFTLPLDLSTPIKLPPVQEELELTPDIVTTKPTTRDPATVDVDLARPQPHRPSQAPQDELSTDVITPPIWTPLALKVAASRSSPREDDSKEPSQKADKKHKISETETTSIQGTQHQASDQVVPVSVNLVTTCMTSVTLQSSTSPLPAKQARRVPSDSDVYLDALLDDECALFTCRLQTLLQDSSESERGIPDPVAQTLLEGDNMHFVPIQDESVTTPVEGSAFAAYSPV